MSLFPISESDDFVVHYDPMRGMYRVTVFNDGHFWDEYWFDAYEDKELDKSFPQTIGNITFYSKAELFEWVENQQKTQEFDVSFQKAVNSWNAAPLVNPISPEDLRRVMEQFGQLNDDNIISNIKGRLYDNI